MRILTYKRTHVGDPDPAGRFGLYDCMGRIRELDFDAVIGVGGIGREPKEFGIDRKINWIGIGATKRPRPEGGGSVITFDDFLLLEEKGPWLHEFAPRLARRIYEKNVRFLLKGYSAEEQAEAVAILVWGASQASSARYREDRPALAGVCSSTASASTRSCR